MTGVEVEIVRSVLGALLRLKQMSQRSAAIEARWDRGALNRFLKGKIHQPRFETLVRIAQAVKMELPKMLDIVGGLRGRVEEAGCSWEEIPGETDCSKALFLIKRAEERKFLDEMVLTVLIEQSKGWVLEKWVRRELGAEETGEPLWPGVSVFFGGPKVSEPFAGREEELAELRKGMRRKKGIVAVVGMAGRGKSCLVGEWFKRRKGKPAEGVGLFWRRVYDTGYSFDRFVSDLHVYLTGREINAQAVPTVEGRAALALAALKGRPCWIVLDGVERWLKRWAAAPDAGVENLTIDDRAGQDEVLDKFLQDAAFWENGSRLVLTTRAAPSALDENPPVMIGQAHGNEKRLADLKEDEAVTLLRKLGVQGDERKMREAVKAYGCHAFAVHVLGLLIFERYGGDVSRWEEVNPFEEEKKGRDGAEKGSKTAKTASPPGEKKKPARPKTKQAPADLAEVLATDAHLYVK